jgi:hypothetical protein
VKDLNVLAREWADCELALEAALDAEVAAVEHRQVCNARLDDARDTFRAAADQRRAEIRVEARGYRPPTIAELAPPEVSNPSEWPSIIYPEPSSFYPRPIRLEHPGGERERGVDDGGAGEAGGEPEADHGDDGDTRHEVS